MTEDSPLLPSALRRVRASVLLPLLGGNLLLAAAAVFALNIPDSHVWQLALSALLGLGLISGFLLWNGTALRRLRAPTNLTPLWSSALILGAWLLLAASFWLLIRTAEPNLELRAGYWNSQLSPGMRNTLSYTRLVSWQQAALNALRWVIVPALLLPFAIETTSFGLHAAALARACRLLLSIRHWAVAIVALGLASWFVPVLVAWHPLHTVGGEVLSAVLRLTLAVLVAIAALLALLAVDAELLHRRLVATLTKAEQPGTQA